MEASGKEDYKGKEMGAVLEEDDLKEWCRSGAIELPPDYDTRLQVLGMDDHHQLIL